MRKRKIGGSAIGLTAPAWEITRRYEHPTVFLIRGTVVDPNRIVRQLLGIEPLTPVELAVADQNGDGVLDIADALLAGLYHVSPRNMVLWAGVAIGLEEGVTDSAGGGCGDAAGNRLRRSRPHR